MLPSLPPIEIDPDIRERVLRENKFRLFLIKLMSAFSWPFSFLIGRLGITFVDYLVNVVWLFFLAMVLAIFSSGLRPAELYLISWVYPWYFGAFFTVLYFVCSYYACEFSTNTYRKLRNEMEYLQVRRNGRRYEENVLAKQPSRLARLYKLKKDFERASRARRF